MVCQNSNITRLVDDRCKLAGINRHLCDLVVRVSRVANKRDALKRAVQLFTEAAEGDATAIELQAAESCVMYRAEELRRVCSEEAAKHEAFLKMREEERCQANSKY